MWPPFYLAIVTYNAWTYPVKKYSRFVRGIVRAVKPFEMEKLRLIKMEKHLAICFAIGNWICLSQCFGSIQSKMKSLATRYVKLEKTLGLDIKNKQTNAFISYHCCLGIRLLKIML